MKVGFFVPCYIDALHPQAAISSYNLLKRFKDLDIEFIEKAVCCGLPLTDMGYNKKVCHMEQNLVSLLSPYDVIVMPSGVCSEQFRDHFDAVEQTEEVKRIRENTYDIVDFLHDVLKSRVIALASDIQWPCGST